MGKGSERTGICFKKFVREKNNLVQHRDQGHKGELFSSFVEENDNNLPHVSLAEKRA